MFVVVINNLINAERIDCIKIPFSDFICGQRDAHEGSITFTKNMDFMFLIGNGQYVSNRKLYSH